MSDWVGVNNDPETHRVGINRAWCFQDAEWCYRHDLCPCCDQRRIPKRWQGMNVGDVLEELQAEVTELLDNADMFGREYAMASHAYRDVLALIRGEKK